MQSKHLKPVPYHPATNERAVQTIKQDLKNIEGASIQKKLLFTIRLTPHSTTGVAPVKLFSDSRQLAMSSTFKMN